MKKSRRQQKDNSSNGNDFPTNPFDGLDPGLFAERSDDIGVSENATANTGNSNNKHITFYIRREKKGRAGKVVTLISNPNGDYQDSITDLARDLRKSLGTGGTCTKDNIELQGDHRRACAEWLQNRGYKLKGEVDI